MYFQLPVQPHRQLFGGISCWIDCSEEEAAQVEAAAAVRGRVVARGEAVETSLVLARAEAVSARSAAIALPTRLDRDVSTLLAHNAAQR
jgi:hypothetical protein